MKPNPLTRFVRFLALHRRAVAALAAMLAVGALGVVATGRDQTFVTLVVAARSVDAGQTRTAAALSTEVPSHLVPEGAVADPAAAAGRLTAAALPRGAILTASALVTSAGRTTAEGRLILPIPLTQPELAGLLHPGDPVTLLLGEATGGTTVVDDAVIVSLPETNSGGLFGGSSSYLLVDLSEQDAALVTAASTVTVALR
jgi:hypothetical protein